MVGCQNVLTLQLLVRLQLIMIGSHLFVTMYVYRHLRSHHQHPCPGRVPGPVPNVEEQHRQQMDTVDGHHDTWTSGGMRPPTNETVPCPRADEASHHAHSTLTSALPCRRMRQFHPRPQHPPFLVNLKLVIIRYSTIG